METIKDIIDELRRLNDGGFPLDGESSHPLVEDMRLLADRIEQAVTNCNRLKMRVALKKAEKTLSEFMGSCDCLADVRAALAAPPRNCDRHSDFCSAIRAFAKDQPNTKKKWDMERYCLFANWLFAEAKGDANVKKA